jgi:hypothetical protein
LRTPKLDKSKNFMFVTIDCIKHQSLIVGRINMKSKRTSFFVPLKEQCHKDFLLQVFS